MQRHLDAAPPDRDQPKPLLYDATTLLCASMHAVGVGLLAAARWHPGARKIEAPQARSQFRFGYTVYARIFLSFDMEMIFMYPWAMVFVSIGLEAFGDLFVFSAILSAGIAYAWKMKGLAWE